MSLNGLHWQTRRGEPIQVGDGVVVTPEVRSLVGGGPFGRFAWHRPTAALVRHGQQTWRLPIRDANQLAQLGLIGLALGFILLGLTGSRMKGEPGRG